MEVIVFRPCVFCHPYQPRGLVQSASYNLHDNANRLILFISKYKDVLEMLFQAQDCKVPSHHWYLSAGGVPRGDPKSTGALPVPSSLSICSQQGTVPIAAAV